MSDEDLQQQWQWRGQTLPEGWPDVPDAPTQANLAGEAETGTEQSTEHSPEQSPDQSSEHPANEGKPDEPKKSSRKRSLALADEMPDISDASRQALRDAAV